MQFRIYRGGQNIICHINTIIVERQGFVDPSIHCVLAGDLSFRSQCVWTGHRRVKQASLVQTLFRMKTAKNWTKKTDLRMLDTLILLLCSLFSWCWVYSALWSLMNLVRLGQRWKGSLTAQVDWPSTEQMSKPWVDILHLHEIVIFPNDILWTTRLINMKIG